MLRRYKKISSHSVLFSAIGFWFVFFLASPDLARASALSDLAASMKPGTWAQLATNNIVTALTSADWGGGSSNDILYYSDDLVWDPTSRQAFFSGGDHNWGIPTTVKFVKYVESSNSWVEIGIPPWAGGVMHGYDHSAIDAAHRLFYHRPYGEQQVHKYNIDTQTWGQALPIPSFGDFYGASCCDALEYFPELNGLVWVNGGGGVYLYSNATNQWTRLATGLSLGGTWHLAEYNPVHKVMIFYSAQTGKLYKLNSSGQVSALRNPPVSLYNGSNGLLTVDPVSGDYIALTGSSLQPYKYDVLTDTWQVLSAANQPSFSGDGVVAAPINTYGVIFFATCAGGGASSCTVYLYKHAAGTSTPPPSTPAPTVSLSANPTSVVSGSAATLAWNSTNATSCIASGGWSGTKAGSGSQSTGNLTANTTFALTCTGTGGSTNQSATVTVTSSTPPPSGGQTFAGKCAQTGVINCWAFDSSSELRYVWPTACDAAMSGKTRYTLSGDRHDLGNTVATVQSGQCVFPVIDTTVVHSGAGSLKFTVPSNSGADSGGYFTEVFKRLPTGGFAYVGPGSSLGNVLYFQFYQRFDPNFLNTDYNCVNGGCGGWKQIIWYGNPPHGSSSSSIEVTHNNGWERGVPQMYGQQGHDDYGVQDVAGCPYAGSGFSSRANYPEPPCVRYKANQWMEFTGRIEIRGAADAPTSRVQLWVDGKLVIDHGQAKINWGGSDGDGIGAFLATVYHTNKDSSQVHPVGYTWMDDIIVSTQPIAMGGAGSPTPGPTSPPAAPSSLAVK